MIAVLLILLIPLTGMTLLAWYGDSPKAGIINIRCNSLALAAAVWLAVDILWNGPQLFVENMLYIDSFNVYLVALTAFVGLTTSIFSGPYMQHEKDIGRLTG